MPRGSQLCLRALTGLAALFVLVQCGGSSDQAASSATATQAPTETVESTIAKTTVPVETTLPASTTTTVITTTTAAPEPTTTTIPAPVIDPNCPPTPHAAVIDRARQRAWLCDNGFALPEFVITTAREMPDPALYHVYGKSMTTSSRFGGHYSTMTHFVAFARGEKTGARIGFHTIPVLTNGEYVQPLESVGTDERFGDSSGCIRVLPDQGPIIWDWLQKGDGVRVLT